MSTLELILVAVLSGAGTLVIRCLPLGLHERLRTGKTERRWHQMLAAIGPAAIVSLLTVSLVAVIEPEAPVRSVVPGLCGLLGVWLGRKLLHNNIAAGTIAGVLAYAACSLLLA